MEAAIAKAIIWLTFCVMTWGLWKHGDEFADGNIEKEARK